MLIALISTHRRMMRRNIRRIIQQTRRDLFTVIVEATKRIIHDSIFIFGEKLWPLG